MAQGFSDGVAILDKSVERRKLSIEVIDKLDNGGDSTVIQSSEVEDGYVRPGYAAVNTTLEGNFDGISNRFVELKQTIAANIENWDCASDIPAPEINLSMPLSSGLTDTMIGKKSVMVMNIKGHNLTSPISFEIPKGYEVIKSADWDDMKGGMVTLSFTPTNTIDYKGVLVVYSKTGAKNLQSVEKHIPLDNLGLNRR